MKTLYLHVGLSKTGTTAIQDFFGHNRRRLKEEYHLCYPLQEQYPFTIGLFELVRGRPGKLADRYRSEVRQLRKAFEKNDDCDMLLSSEYLTEGPGFQDALKRLISDLGVSPAALKIIIYLRRQDELLQSFAAQKLKHDSSVDPLDMDSILNLFPAIREGYSALCGFLASLCAPGNLTVRCYERKKLADGDIVSDFLAVLNISKDPEFSRSTRVSNPSLSRELLAFRLAVNPLLVAYGVHTMFLFPEEMIPQRKGGTESVNLLNADIRLALLQRAEDDNNLTARTFLSPPAEQLFTGALPSSSDKSFEPASDQELRAVYRQFAQAAPVRALWLLGLIEKSLKHSDPSVRMAAERLRKPLLDCHILPWPFYAVRRLPRKVLGIFRIWPFVFILKKMAALSETER